MKIGRGVSLLIGLVGLAACAAPPAGDSPDGAWDWDLPAHFAPPVVPEDNPMSAEKVALGRRLFYDTRLSANGTQSCGSCHVQALAFTDGRARGLGSTGEVHPRGAMGLTNVAYNSRLGWANPLLARLEHQALLPLFGETPVEMGMAGLEALLLGRLEGDAVYPAAFAAAFPEDPAPSVAHVVEAIATFERTLISADSPYDRFVAGDTGALTASAQRGLALFMSERLECFHCHGGFNFTGSLDHEGLPTPEVAFHNTGLYNVDGQGAYPADNPGVLEVSGEPADMGRFKAPTLRNIAVTAPYMHDGSIATLSEVLDHYAAGGRELTSGPHAGDGAASPLKSELLAGFLLSPEEKVDVLHFLEALTDEGFLTDPRFSDPGE